MRTHPTHATTPLSPASDGSRAVGHPAGGRPASALTRVRDSGGAAADLVAQFEAQGLGGAPTTIVVFCSPAYDGVGLAAALRERYPSAEVVGCTTAGEFVERDGSVGGVSAIALPAGTARGAYAAIARFDYGVEAGIRAAAQRLGRLADADLRTLDPKRWVGVVLFEGLGMKEEEANEVLGIVAPQLVFVGGSAGDDLAFRETRVFHNAEATNDGAVLLLLDMAVPFTFTKTCSVEPTRHRFTVTRADEANRVVYELDGRPAIEVYAEATGVAPSQVDAQLFMKHPVGMLLDGDPWIRSPQQAVAGGGIKFYCRMTEGAEVTVMRTADIVAGTRDALALAAREVGGRAGGALLFNCILRRLELDASNAHEQFRATLAGVPTAGFHTYGETYVGHVNQTCTGLVFG